MGTAYLPVGKYSRWKLTLCAVLPLSSKDDITASFGIVFAGVFLAGDAFEGVPDQQVGDLLRASVRDVLHSERP